MEICIPSLQVSAAELALNSSSFFERLPPSTPNLYTAYKRDCPRLVGVHGHQPCIVLLGDLGTGIEQSKTLRRPDHHGDAFYSHEILDSFSVEEIQQLPIPTLPSFVRYLCVLFFSHGDEMHRIRLEKVVDGMNIDAAWCQGNLFDRVHVQYVLDLVNSKKDRIDDFSGNLVTCYIANQKTAESITHIPGSGLFLMHIYE